MAENLHRIDRSVEVVHEGEMSEEFNYADINAHFVVYRFYQQITNQSDKNEESTCSHSEVLHSGTFSQRQQQRTNSVLTETNDLCDDSLLDCVTDMFDQN